MNHFSGITQDEEISLRTRVEVLSNVLLQLISIYEESLSVKQLSYANDLLDKIAVGYLGDEECDSTYAQQLRQENYKISARAAEFSAQARISNLLHELMPDGAWIVE